MENATIFLQIGERCVRSLVAVLNVEIDLVKVVDKAKYDKAKEPKYGKSSSV